MNTPEEEAILIEALSTAHRDRDPDGIRFHAAWFDLDEAGRRRAFEEITRQRRLEAALDPAGLSTTARAVLAKIKR